MNKVHASVTLTFAFLVVMAGTSIAQQLRLETADEYFIQFDPAINFQAIDQELSLNPSSVDVLLKRARLKLLYGMDTEAMEDIELINTLNPYALYLHGFYGTGGYAEVIDAQPESALAEIALDERLSYYREWLDEQLALEGVSREERKALIAVLDTMGKGQFDQAIGLLETHISQFPASAVAYDLKSVAFTELQQYDRAVEALSRAVEIDPAYAMAWYNFGRIERLNGRYAMALDYFDQAITLRANFSKAYFERAMINKQLMDIESAKDDYTFIIEQDNELKEEAILNRGLARKMSGDFEGALEDLSLAIENDPDNAVLYKNRGNLFLLLGQLEDAMKDYDEAISLDRSFAEAYHNRGLTYYIQGEKSRCCNDLRESYRLGFETAGDKLELLCNR